MDKNLRSNKSAKLEKKNVGSLFWLAVCAAKLVSFKIQQALQFV